MYLKATRFAGRLQIAKYKKPIQGQSKYCKCQTVQALPECNAIFSPGEIFVKIYHQMSNQYEYWKTACYQLAVKLDIEEIKETQLEYLSQELNKFNNAQAEKVKTQRNKYEKFQTDESIEVDKIYNKFYQLKYRFLKSESGSDREFKYYIQLEKLCAEYSVHKEPPQSWTVLLDVQKHIKKEYLQKFNDFAKRLTN